MQRNEVTVTLRTSGKKKRHCRTVELVWK